jgi:hypothetical protein
MYHANASIIAPSADTTPFIAAAERLDAKASAPPLSQHLLPFFLFWKHEEGGRRWA